MFLPYQRLAVDVVLLDRACLNQKLSFQLFFDSKQIVDLTLQRYIFVADTLIDNFLICGAAIEIYNFFPSSLMTDEME
jgi:hypothetical protein